MSRDAERAIKTPLLEKEMTTDQDRKKNVITLYIIDKVIVLTLRPHFALI